MPSGLERQDRRKRVPGSQVVILMFPSFPPLTYPKAPLPASRQIIWDCLGTVSLAERLLQVAEELAMPRVTGMRRDAL